MNFTSVERRTGKTLHASSSTYLIWTCS